MLVTKGLGRFSCHILCQAMLVWFSEAKLFPKGVTRDMKCVQDWALRNGRTLQRLATWPDIYIYMSRFQIRKQQESSCLLLRYPAFGVCINALAVQRAKRLVS